MSNLTKIVCIGDSITFGYELDETNKWTTMLSSSLQTEVINCGINGDTTAGMLSRFNAAISNYKPTHIVIMGGTNDLWFGLKDENIISNIFTMCRQAKYHDIVPIVGVPTPSFNLTELNFVGEDYAECIRSFQNILIDFCNTKELAHINFGLNMCQEHFLEDGLHPNAEGQCVMMKNANALLRKIL